MKRYYYSLLLLLFSMCILLNGCGDNNSESLSAINEVRTPIISDEDAQQASTNFLQCAGCHGQAAEKKAFNKSNIIANWTYQNIYNALKGYKDGTRNIHGMGSLMKGQVSDIEDNILLALSVYISNLSQPASAPSYTVQNEIIYNMYLKNVCYIDLNELSAYYSKDEWDYFYQEDTINLIIQDICPDIDTLLLEEPQLSSLYLYLIRE